MSAVDDWLSGDDADLEAALADPAARRDLVELALIDAILPRMPAPAVRQLPRGHRTAAIAGIVVVAAMIAAWLLRPGPRRGDDVIQSDGDQPMQRIAATSRSMHVHEPDWVAVDTRLGTLVLRPDTEAVVRTAPSALAIFVEIRSGAATFHGQTLPAGTRAGFGDRAAVRRLGPTIVVEVLHRDERRLEAQLPDGTHRNFTLSRSLAIEAPAERGDTVQLILSPDEREVFYITPAR